MSQSEKAVCQPRVVVAGCGHWGKNLVRDFAGLGALAGIVEESPVLRDSMVATYNVRAYTWDEALADGDVDGIVIAAPAVLHHQLASQALQAGKHVFVEKPLALQGKDGESLVALAKQRGRVLMVGHLLQYHPAFIELKKQVAAGRIGRLQYIYSNRLSFGILRREEDVLWSFAPHDLSMVLSLANEEPSAVRAFSAPVLHATIGDFCQVQMEFPSGVKGHLFVSWLHPFKEQRLVVIGDKGALVFEDSAPRAEDKLKFYGNVVAWADGKPTAVKAAGDGEPVAFENSNPLRNECQHFLGAIAGKHSARTDGAEGLRVLRVLERASASFAVKDGGKSDKPKSGVNAHATIGANVTIHESAYVDGRAKIGAATKIWHFSHVLDDVVIGERCNLGQNVVVGPKVVIGNDVKIQNNVSVYEGVVLEDGVFCGPSCVFTNVNNPRAEIARKSEYRQTLVRRGASIGANATIVCGHELGPYCFIAAGAVVADDVPAFALMAGVPAKRIGWMSHAGMKLDSSLVCPETGRRYRETAAGTLEEIT